MLILSVVDIKRTSAELFASSPDPPRTIEPFRSEILEVASLTKVAAASSFAFALVLFHRRLIRTRRLHRRPSPPVEQLSLSAAQLQLPLLATLAQDEQSGSRVLAVETRIPAIRWSIRITVYSRYGSRYIQTIQLKKESIFAAFETEISLYTCFPNLRSLPSAS
jgi:hypothetical protein